MTPRSAFRAALITGVACIAACGSHAVGAVDRPARAGISSGRVPSGDWTRFDYDAQRSGVGPSSTGITAGNVAGLGIRVVHLDGTADSSAVELHAIGIRGRRRDVAVVTTTYGRTIAIDPGTGARLWEYVPPDIGSYEGSHQVTTASPIADPDRRFVYAASPDGLIHKLSLSTGREVRSGHWPARVTFDPGHEKIAPALNIDGSSVLVATGGYYGDAPYYQGHVVEIDRGSGRIVAVWNSLCSEIHHLIDPPRACGVSDSAIWGRAGAVVEPGGGRILIATGNGPFNGSTDWGDSVLELSAGRLRLLHNWTPYGQRSLEAGDTDLGSTEPAVLPQVGGYHLVVQGGKDGKLHVLNLDRLNGTGGPAGPRLGGELQDIDSPGGDEVLTAPVVWRAGGQVYLFVADDSGTAAYVAHGGRRPGLREVWSNGNAGTSPVIAGGLLYVYDEQAGQLRVYEPRRGRAVASLPAAAGHWSSPIVVGGRIILPTGGSTADDSRGSELIIYHLRGR